ncbi:MAG: hypothetical protein JO316_17055 [Abitibacteriaceae bacterium]|nr:hypothetical protein [Abditibacteriaceae bacterium]MBV9867065.1 hypothetical protein [Abditibacteriaceae bacterium]
MTNYRGFDRFLSTSFVLSLLVLGVYVVLEHYNIPAGRFLDWLIGVGSFWWLLVIVTVPWNIHFQARQVIADAAQSQERNIAVNPAHVQFARTWVQRSLWLAIVLHLLSAAGLYALAYFGISSVGYVTSAAALLLTGLRPTVRAYEYIAAQLAAMQQEIRYPREDVATLRGDVEELKGRTRALEQLLDLANGEGWASQTQAYAAHTREEVQQLKRALEQLQNTNIVEHERISRESQHAIAQITADGQFLEHVREIIRFVKSA